MSSCFRKISPRKTGHFLDDLCEPLRNTRRKPLRGSIDNQFRFMGGMTREEEEGWCRAEKGRGERKELISLEKKTNLLSDLSNAKRRGGRVTVGKAAAN